jgi:hypothetical protein
MRERRTFNDPRGPTIYWCAPKYAMLAYENVLDNSPLSATIPPKFQLSNDPHDQK